MKYVTITGGLGNQMFIYAFCLQLRQQGYETILWVPRKKDSKGYGHQGYELCKLFNNVAEVENNSSENKVRMLTIFNSIVRLFPTSWKQKLFNLIGHNIVKVPENFIYYPGVFRNKHKNEIFMGTWQSEQYFEDAKQNVISAFSFNESLVSNKTKELELKISGSNSVSIHIRRGDYLSSQYINGFGGICTEEYYKKAINYIESEQIKDVQYYIFTDDKEWVKNNFNIQNATFVEHNTANDSWQDMYLMSKCRHNIIANSSFSWWGAYLNNNPLKKVVAPKVWWNGFEHDDVVPNSWIRL